MGEKTNYIAGTLIGLALFGSLFFIDHGRLITVQSQLNNIQSPGVIKNSPLPNPPKIIKAVYFTASSAGNQKKIDYLLKLTKETEINAVVIDIKDYSGYIAYDTGLSDVEKYKTAKITIHDLDSLIKELHDAGIYVIARMVIFQDPALASARPDLAVKIGTRVWTDNKGLAWIDPAAADAWNYNIAIAQNAVSKGFDEVNIDYVRFPSDGNLVGISYPFWDGKISKPEVLREFFQKFREGLPEMKLSIDLFGFVMNVKTDFGVGQILENTLPYFDFISPMVYPSHYPPNYLGYPNPALYPYEIIKTAMDGGLARLAIFKQTAKTNTTNFRPWIQDFNLGANYNAAMIKAEIKAITDSMGDGFGGFMIWNPGNVYTEAAYR